MMNKTTISIYLLVIVNFFWGLTFPLISKAGPFISSDLFVLMRFTLASVILLPFLYQQLKHTTRQHIAAGSVVGLLNTIAYNTQTQSLHTLDPASAAFIVGLSVVIVPLILVTFRLKPLKTLEVIAIIVCIIGLYLLTGAKLIHFTIGVALSLTCAVAIALTIIYLERIAKTTINLSLVVFYQVVATALFSLPLLAATSPITLIWNHWTIMALLYCTLIATCINLFLMTYCLRYVNATLGAILFCLEPVFAAIFSYVIVGERYTIEMMIGGVFIITGILLINPKFQTNQ